MLNLVITAAIALSVLLCIMTIILTMRDIRKRKPERFKEAIIAFSVTVGLFLILGALLLTGHVTIFLIAIFFVAIIAVIVKMVQEYQANQK